MSTIHRFRPAVFVVALCTFAISAPVAVNADDQVIGDEQIIAAQEQVPALAPAVPSWDDTSGYGSVERTPADMTASLSGELISGQEQATALAAAAATSWDATSGYGAVEASRAANALPEEPVVLDRGTRAESAILWTILHPAEDTVPVVLSDC